MRLISVLFLFVLVVLSVQTIQAQSTDDKYNTAIEKADEYFAGKDYINAKASYQLALRFKPDAEYPKKQIEKTLELLRKQMELSAEYAEFIQQADEMYESDKLAEARLIYKKALDVLPDKKYPQEQIHAIDSIKSHRQKMRRDYQNAMDKGNKLFDEGNYKDALDEFKTALEIFPEYNHIKEKTEETETLIYEQEKKENDYNIAMQNANFFLQKKNYQSALQEFKKAAAIFPDKKKPQEIIEEINRIISQKEKYEKLITEADELYIVKDYINAKEKYSQALNIDTSKAYAAEMIAKIETTLKNKATSRQEDYDNAIRLGDEHLSKGDLIMAKKQYEFASRIKPDQAYPKEKLEEIRETTEAYENAIALADSNAGNKNYKEALTAYKKASEIIPEEEYPKEKITEIETLLKTMEKEQEKLDEYYLLIASADSLFDKEEFKPAKSKYNEALALIPNQTYPLKRIQEIEQKVIEIARMKDIRQEYMKIIAEADQYMQDEQYRFARAKYKEACELKSDESYPLQRMQEIDRILADIAAYEVKQVKYNNIITVADQLFGQENYEEAIAKYNEALEVLPLEQYPKEKIEQANLALAEIERQTILQQKYDSIIRIADDLLAKENYNKAKTAFQNALSLKENETYPQQKIEDIDAKLIEIAEQKALDTQYRNLIEQAGQLTAEKRYKEAKKIFEDASLLKPGEQYPKSKIAELKQTIARIEQEREAKYNGLIAKADTNFNREEYYKAKQKYLAALELKPAESYPQQKLDECKAYITAIENSKQEAYDQALADGDRFYNAKAYDKAIDYYTRATDLKPDEKYPVEQIALIKKTMNDNIVKDINTDYVTIEDRREKRFTFESIPVKERKNNYILLKIKNLSGKVFKVIMNYGKDDAKSGGTLIRIPDKEKELDYIVRIGTQYKWFSEDNNWISFYPEGGNVEISLIRVTKSD